MSQHGAQMNQNDTPNQQNSSPGALLDARGPPQGTHRGPQGAHMGLHGARNGIRDACWGPKGKSNEAENRPSISQKTVLILGRCLEPNPSQHLQQIVSNLLWEFLFCWWTQMDPPNPHCPRRIGQKFFRSFAEAAKLLVFSWKSNIFEIGSRKKILTRFNNENVQIFFADLFCIFLFFLRSFL